MKNYIFLITILLLFIQPAQGQRQEKSLVNWISLEQMEKLEKAAPRKVLIDMYTDWCGWCKKMDHDTYDNPVIANYINAHYYAVKFNAESTEPVVFQGHTFINEEKGDRPVHQLALAFFQSTKLQVSYPTVFYLDEHLQLITPWPGYVDALQEEVLLHYIVDEKYKPMPLEEYKKTFVSHLHDAPSVGTEIAGSQKTAENKKHSIKKSK